MLSRILNLRDGVPVQASAYVPASVLPPPPKITAEEGTASSDHSRALENENCVLRARVQQLEQELAAARRESFENGRRQGDQQARLETAPFLERLHASLAEFTNLRAEMRRRAEKDVVQLALLIAKRVLHREISVDANALAALARVLFERLAHSETYRVAVHPSFAAGIVAALPPNLVQRVHIESDPACAPGTLIIRSDEGLVDASVDAQLEEIGRGLADRLSRA